MARRLLAPELAEQAPADHCRYLGVVCLLLRTTRSVSPYYHLNITDRRVPLTTVVETTHVVDPDARRRPPALRLQVRRPGAPGPRAAGRRSVERDVPRHARTIFPDLRDDEIVSTSVVQRARVTEPVHLVGGAKRLPEMFPVPGLALASTAHVYPEIVNGQAVIGVADRVVARDPRAASGRTAGGGMNCGQFQSSRRRVK